MPGSPTCPRCDAVVRPPGLWSSDWTCPLHGAVAPLHPAPVPSVEGLRKIAGQARVPVWLPWPLPSAWLVTGLRHAGDERSGPVATVLACSGPHPLRTGETSPAAADLLLVAEQPGTGLGAHLAGLQDVDPGEAVSTGAPAAKVHARGHPTPLWHVPTPADSAAYVGEACGVWLWALLWPDSAGALLLEDLSLVDARESGPALDPPVGALSPRLGRPGTALR